MGFVVKTISIPMAGEESIGCKQECTNNLYFSPVSSYYSSFLKDQSVRMSLDYFFSLFKECQIVTTEMQGTHRVKLCFPC